MKVFLVYSMRFLSMASERVPEWPQNDLNMTLPGPPQTGPEMALIDPQIDPQETYGPE